MVETYKDQIKYYHKDDRSIVSILSAGLNDAKIYVGQDRGISTLESFNERMIELIRDLKEISDKLVVFLYWEHNETCLIPKLQRCGNFISFNNARTELFNEELRKICNQLDVQILEVKTPGKDWQNDCLYHDGLHPNQKGYDLVYKQLKSILKI